jgi:hypothetical protein
MEPLKENWNTAIHLSWKNKSWVIGVAGKSKKQGLRLERIDKTKNDR